MARRSSLKATGEPYQVFFEVSGTGQTFEQTKKKVRWVLGFTDMEQEIEVVLKHSLLSGKKTIIENGQQIVSATNLLATDFSHGWTSPSCGHFFRIEAQVTLSQDTYVLSVDGVRFHELQRKPAGGFKKVESTPTGRYANESTTDSAQRRQSSTANRPLSTPSSSAQSGDRHSLRQKIPSAANVTDSFDPFASQSAPIDPFANKSTGTVTAKPDVDLLGDPFGTPAPAAPAPARSPAVAADPFFATSTPSAAAQLFDPFNGQTAAPAPAPAPAAAHDPFTLPTPPTTTNGNGHAHKPAHQDFLGFDSSPQKPAARRSSAVEIAQDFANMTFSAPIQQQQQQVARPQSVPSPAPAPAAAPVAKTTPTKSADLWQSDLVNLNLSNENSNERRQSATVNTGPSLDSLMTGSVPQQRRSSMMVGSAAPPMGYGMQPMMGAPPAQSMPMQSAPIMMAPQQRGSISMTGAPMMSTGYSTGAAPMTGYSMGMQPPSMGMANAGNTNAGASKSSLDSLDWKNFQ